MNFFLHETRARWQKRFFRLKLKYLCAKVKCKRLHVMHSKKCVEQQSTDEWKKNRIPKIHLTNVLIVKQEFMPVHLKWHFQEFGSDNVSLFALIPYDDGPNFRPLLLLSFGIKNLAALFLPLISFRSRNLPHAHSYSAEIFLRIHWKKNRIVNLCVHKIIYVWTGH